MVDMVTEPLGSACCHIYQIPSNKSYRSIHRSTEKCQAAVYNNDPRYLNAILNARHWKMVGSTPVSVYMDPKLGLSSARTGIRVNVNGSVRSV